MAQTMADPARDAYESLAPYYDRFTVHHDYELWTSRIRELLRLHGDPRGRMLDVGCGTGKSFEPFLEEYEVTAVDLSPAMAAHAELRARGRARVLCADMRSLPDLGRFELVTALDDAVNYLLTSPELAAALRSVRRLLAPGGRLVFDVNLLHTYRTFFATSSVMSEPGLLLAWHGTTDPQTPAGVMATACLYAFAEHPDGGWSLSTSEHVQRHWPQPELLDAMSCAGLRPLGVYGQHYDARFVPDAEELVHTKALVIACRDDER